jgi:hypothetical protein
MVCTDGRLNGREATAPGAWTAASSRHRPVPTAIRAAYHFNINAARVWDGATRTVRPSPSAVAGFQTSRRMLRPLRMLRRAPAIIHRATCRLGSTKRLRQISLLASRL